MNGPRVSADGTGHVFASPLDTYMGITVFRNGALARQRVRDQFGMTWSDFSDALRQTPAGNDGAMVLPWFEPEITPRVSSPGIRMWGLENASAARHVRAIVEGQVMALARHSEWMGVRPRTIHATGGGAGNREILQVVADVFDAEVLRFEVTDSAALGAALRAFQADSGTPWRDVADWFAPMAPDRVRPVHEHVARYRKLRDVHRAREREALR
jgi:xylulokinase